MSLDQRVKTTYKPCLGCHSDFDKGRTAQPPEHCPYQHRHEEKACEDCKRRGDDDK